jgi:alanine racemase
MEPRVENPYNRLEVDLEAIAGNYGRLRGLLPPGSRVAAVVKADAYGHGLLPVVRRLEREGVDALAVAVWTEGELLRRQGFRGTVLVLLGHEPAEARQVAELGLTPVLGRPECLDALEQAARDLGRPIACHLKVDTGMGRLGLEPGEVPAVLEHFSRSGLLDITGVVSHLATGGEPGSDHAAGQAKAFEELLQGLRAADYALPDSSLWGSGGLLAPPGPAVGPTGLVRLGVSLYGGLPSAGSVGRVKLETAMRFTSRLLQVKDIAEGCPVSYGCTWRAPCDSTIGVIPVGYADGYPRSASNRAQVLVGGRLAPVRGRVCMNLTMVDLTGCPSHPSPGDEVVLLGAQGDQAIGLDQLADWAGTIGYEVCCSLGRANPRYYQPA